MFPGIYRLLRKACGMLRGADGVSRETCGIFPEADERLVVVADHEEVAVVLRQDPAVAGDGERRAGGAEWTTS